MKLWQRRVIGVLMLAGSASGLAIIVLTVSRLQLDPATGLIFLAFFAVFVYGIVVGVLMLRQHRSGSALALPFWLLQIPVLQSKWLTYELFTGLKVDVLFWQDPDLKLAFNFQFGAQFEFYIGAGSEFAAGINVIAIFIAWLLWKEAVRDPDTALGPEG